MLLTYGAFSVVRAFVEERESRSLELELTAPVGRWERAVGSALGPAAVAWCVAGLGVFLQLLAVSAGGVTIGEALGRILVMASACAKMLALVLIVAAFAPSMAAALVGAGALTALFLAFIALFVDSAGGSGTSFAWLLPLVGFFSACLPPDAFSGRPDMDAYAVLMPALEPVFAAAALGLAAAIVGDGRARPEWDAPRRFRPVVLAVFAAASCAYLVLVATSLGDWNDLAQAQTLAVLVVAVLATPGARLAREGAAKPKGLLGAFSRSSLPYVFLLILVLVGGATQAAATLIEPGTPMGWQPAGWFEPGWSVAVWWMLGALIASFLAAFVTQICLAFSDRSGRVVGAALSAGLISLWLLAAEAEGHIDESAIFNAAAWLLELVPYWPHGAVRGASFAVIVLLLLAAYVHARFAFRPGARASASAPAGPRRASLSSPLWRGMRMGVLLSLRPTWKLCVFTGLAVSAALCAFFPLFRTAPYHPYAGDISLGIVAGALFVLGPYFALRSIARERSERTLDMLLAVPGGSALGGGIGRLLGSTAPAWVVAAAVSVPAIVAAAVDPTWTARIALAAVMIPAAALAVSAIAMLIASCARSEAWATLAAAAVVFTVLVGGADFGSWSDDEPVMMLLGSWAWAFDADAKLAALAIVPVYLLIAAVASTLAERILRESGKAPLRWRGAFWILLAWALCWAAVEAVMPTDIHDAATQAMSLVLFLGLMVATVSPRDELLRPVMAARGAGGGLARGDSLAWLAAAAMAAPLLLFDLAHSCIGDSGGPEGILERFLFVASLAASASIATQFCRMSLRRYGTQAAAFCVAGLVLLYSIVGGSVFGLDVVFSFPRHRIGDPSSPALLILLVVIPWALLLIRRSRVSFVKLLLRKREERERMVAARVAG